MKSPTLVALPYGVATEIRPLVAVAGTVVAMLVVVLDATNAGLVLNPTLLLLPVVSKFIPVIVTAVPAGPIAGAKPETVGALLGPTTNDAALVAVPFGDVTLIDPVVAPAGTCATSCVADADVTTAATPLNLTVFAAVVVPNPVPLMVTAVPDGPPLGVNSTIPTEPAFVRVIDNMLPSAS